MKNILTGLLFLVFINFLHSQNTYSLTLDEAVDYAMEHSPKIINTKLSVLDAKKQKIETRAIGLPKVNLKSTYNYYIDIPTQIMPDFISPAVYGVLLQEKLISEYTPGATQYFEAQFGQKHNVNVTGDISSLLFNGEYIVALKTAKVYEDFSNMQLTSASKEVKDNTIEAFLPVLLVVENIAELDNNINNLKQLRFEMDQMYNEGFVEKLDVDRIDLSLQNLQIEKENLIRQETMAKNALKTSLGMEITDSLIINDNIDELMSEIDDATLFNNFNIENRPDYALMNKNLELLDLNVKRYKSYYLPSLSGFASYGKTFTGNSLSDLKDYPTSLVGLQFNYNIFDGFNRSAKIQRAKIAYDISKNNVENTSNYINMEVENNRIAFLNAVKKLDSREENLELAERIYNTTKIKYKEGVGSSIELNQAEQSLYQAQTYVLQAKYDLLHSKYKLKSSLGL